ncbi:L-fuculose-phosphate aldolase [Candidatus Merdisoma sp. JLR.KK006]|uniref:L-fuculose-phosphate aldolase n=1 Tax=Candidatus Merdisoma sp. JLR.KK006 TaxID=3112626 RepID=UPI002FF17496
MLMEQERTEIVEYLKMLITHGLTKGTGGNISVYSPELKLMAISPSGMDYFKLMPEDIVIMDPEGNVVDGKRKPSSEYEMHGIFYRERTDILSVVHAHSPYASILACLNWGIEPCSYLIGSAGRNVRCTKYETFGTEELAQSALEGMKDRYAVLLGNHGLLAGGLDLPTAFDTAEEIEFCAEIYYKCKAVGEPVLLNKEQMDVIIEKFAAYGVQPEAEE